MWKDFESQNFFKIDSWHIKIEKFENTELLCSFSYTFAIFETP